MYIGLFPDVAPRPCFCPSPINHEALDKVSLVSFSRMGLPQLAPSPMPRKISDFRNMKVFCKIQCEKTCVLKKGSDVEMQPTC